MNQNQNEKKPGLLCEDRNALEVETSDGHQKIVRTNDREAEAQRLRESEDKNHDRPLHD